MKVLVAEDHERLARAVACLLYTSWLSGELEALHAASPRAAAARRAASPLDRRYVVVISLRLPCLVYEAPSTI